MAAGKGDPGRALHVPTVSHEAHEAHEGHEEEHEANQDGFSWSLLCGFDPSHESKPSAGAWEQAVPSVFGAMKKLRPVESSAAWSPAASWRPLTCRLSARYGRYRGSEMLLSPQELRWSHTDCLSFHGDGHVRLVINR